MARKLWLITGCAIGADLAIGAFVFLAPSFESYSTIADLWVVGIWAALALWVMLPGARRSHQIGAGSGLALAVALSLSTSWFGFGAFFLGYLGAILLVTTVLVFGALRLFRKTPRVRALVVPVTMMLMCVVGILLSAWSAKPGPAIPGQAMSVSDELKYIHDMEQEDRFTGVWMIDMGRDAARLRRVKEMYRLGAIREPMDQLHAAMVYQHATCDEDFRVAYELAKAAADKGMDEGHPPLFEMAYDRWQLALGKSQKYYTQMVPLPIRRPCPAGN
jgi:hypothetical protein